MAQRCPEPGKLQGRDLVARGDFDRVKLVPLGRAGAHAGAMLDR
jgi:hypothetical protein